MNKEELIEKIKEVLQDIEDIEFAFLFGSYARNEEDVLSDIDIAIYQKKKKSKYNYIMQEFEIESKLLETIPNKQFDVRSLNIAPIIVIGEIINNGKLIFARNKSFLNDYVEINRLKFMDYMIIYKPMLEERYQMLLNGE